MKNNFKLVGLSKPKSFTCQTANENIFHATSEMSHEKFDELFKYADGNWSDKKMVEVEHDGFRSDGTPINPNVISVFEQ